MHLVLPRHIRSSGKGFYQVIVVMPDVAGLACFDVLANQIILEAEHMPIVGR